MRKIITIRELSVVGLFIISTLAWNLSVAQEKSYWKQFVIPQEPSVREYDRFALVIEYAGSRNDLKRMGIEVFRRLDDLHYIASGPDSQIMPPVKFIGYANDLWKLDGNSLRAYSTQDSVPGEVGLEVTDIEAFHTSMNALKILYTLVDKYQNFLRIKINSKESVGKLLSISSVRAVNLTPVRPYEETPLRDFNYNVNQINRLRHEEPDLNGSGLVVSVKEQSYDVNDIDFKGRHIESGLNAEETSNHSTEMATIIGGAGNSSFQGRGIAWGTNLSSSDFSSTLPDHDEDYANLKVSVQNHSYGTLPENYYGIEARAYDLSANANPQLLHVFSAGNNGFFTHTGGPYAGVSSYANLTGNFKMAKNVLAVGGVDTVYSVLENLSRGPAYDGRIKPELVAYSLTGASSAAAMVSGVVLLLQEEYLNRQGSLPHSALLKAILINSADDVGSAGIDYSAGYGNMNAYKAHKTITDQRYFEGQVNQDEVLTFEIDIPENAKNLKVTVAWNDMAAEANAGIALINDLDLMLSHQSSGDIYLPWVLSSYPHLDSLKAPAKRLVDRINNVEQISTPDPTPGVYQVRVAGHNISSEAQKFFIAYQWDTADEFTWTFPTGSDNMPQDGEFQSFFRWESTLPYAKGALEYSLDDGTTWKSIATDVDLSLGYYSWQPPEISATAKARMLISDNIYVTEDFVISRPLSVQVGFDCSDSLMLIWHKADNADRYLISTLGSRYLETVKESTDTLVVLNKDAFPQDQFTVTPIIDGKPGLRNLTFAYGLRGSGCYIQRFFSNRNLENGIDLSLLLGTTYQIKQVHLQRLQGDGFIDIHSVSEPTSTAINYTDTQARDGENVYRVRLVFRDDNELFSEEQSILYLKTTVALLFPNPIARFQNLSILLKNFGNNKALFLLYDAQGQLLYKKELARERDEVPFQAFRKGLYLYEVVSAEERQSGRIMVK